VGDESAGDDELSLALLSALARAARRRYARCGGTDSLAYPEDDYDRLAAIKRRYDSTNLFRVNQNIIPDG
jgi:FAD/FMN-containing dehydrogenase